jgi:hypothetical protein
MLRKKLLYGAAFFVASNKQGIVHGLPEPIILVLSGHMPIKLYG